MKIAVNTRFLLPGRMEGIGWFTFETLKRIVQNHPEHEFLFFFDRPHDPQFIFAPNVRAIEIFPPARHPLLWFAFFEISLPLALQHHKPDLLLSTDGFLPLTSKIPSVLVMHDLNYEHLPQLLPWSTLAYYRWFLPRYAHKATRIVTVSEFSKSDIVSTYQISPEKIDVAHNGANEIFKPLDEETKMKIKNQFSGGADYLLFVGSLHPRKNVIRLLQAFELFKNEHPCDIKLIVVGEKMFGEQALENTYRQMTHAGDVVFTGRLKPEELHHVTASAMALVFVPLFEGFGIPVVEAMKCGTPVIASNITSMPEVAGDAALYADPYSVMSIKKAMGKMVNDGKLRESLSAMGLERSKMFTWDITAQKVWKSIEIVMDTI